MAGKKLHISPPEDTQCFISYAWESKAHKEWVLRLANDLQKNGVSTLLDTFDLRVGEDFVAFMEQSIATAKFVLLICIPKFAEKANMRKGGVGYETAIITGEIFEESPSSKFIPLLRSGEDKEALPNYLKTRVYIDFRKNYNRGLEKLLRAIYEQPEYRRSELGKAPHFTSVELVSDFKKPKEPEKASNRNVEIPKSLISRISSKPIPDKGIPFNQGVFVNFIYTAEHWPISQAIVFAILACGFIPRSVAETDTEIITRTQKLTSLVASCRYGVFDLSVLNTDLHSLNVTLELGLFIGAQRLGGLDQENKSVLIFDGFLGKARLMSDLAGQDIYFYEFSIKKAVTGIRNWLSVSSKIKMPSAEYIHEQYEQFIKILPEITEQIQWDYKNLSFIEFVALVQAWIDSNYAR